MYGYAGYGRLESGELDIEQISSPGAILTPVDSVEVHAPSGDSGDRYNFPKTSMYRLYCQSVMYSVEV